MNFNSHMHFTNRINYKHPPIVLSTIAVNDSINIKFNIFVHIQ